MSDSGKPGTRLCKFAEQRMVVYETSIAVQNAIAEVEEIWEKINAVIEPFQSSLDSAQAKLDHHHMRMIAALDRLKVA